MGANGAPISLPSQLWRLVWGVVTDPVEALEAIGRDDRGDRPSPTAALLFVGALGAAFGLVVAAATLLGEAAPWAGGVGLALGRFVGTGVGLVFGVYLAASAVIWGVARMLGGQASFAVILTAWAASYVPTAVWFLGNLLAHVGSSLVNPPPEEPLGVPWLAAGGWLIIVFLAFTLALFLWKSLLLYLTLRIIARLDFRRIVLAAVVLGLVVILYWLAGLNLGWFKVPFI